MAQQNRHRDVRARSGALYTGDFGHGEAVALIHAFPLNGRMWQPQIEGLTGRFRLIAPDLAGFGLSAAPATPLSFADHARSVLETINLLGVERVVVVASSVGGRVALALADELGARLQGLLLANTNIGSNDAASDSLHHELAAEVETSGVDVVADEYLPKLLGASTQRNRPELIEDLRAMVRENTPTGVAGMLRAMTAGQQLSTALRPVRCPVLCVGGAEDVLTPFEEISWFAKRIPGALTENIPEAGHLPNLESPELFNDCMIRLVAECAST